MDQTPEEKTLTDAFLAYARHRKSCKACKEADKYCISLCDEGMELAVKVDDIWSAVIET